MLHKIFVGIGSNIDREKNIKSCIEILKDLGYKLVEVDLPFVSSGRNINVGVLIPEAISIHRQFLKKSEMYTKTVINRLLGGIGVTADEYLDASRAMSAFNYQMSAKMKDIDALLTPTVPVIAPNIEDSYDPNTFCLLYTSPSPRDS